MLLMGMISPGFSLLLLPSQHLSGNTSKASCTRSPSHVHHAFNHLHNQEAGGSHGVGASCGHGLHPCLAVGCRATGCWAGHVQAAGAPQPAVSGVLAVPSTVLVHGRSSTAEPRGRSSPKTHLDAAGAGPCWNLQIALLQESCPGSRAGEHRAAGDLAGL